ncbi:hypothetical protein BCR34DRAFT_610661 [Clohesyomyces aquaticus]|uniref:Ankyrin repeat-containing domain protein n=1 Tax=Clohesyomyces aquaticus TaxID=1231657 RepID=A0A1Y2A5G2_9PLEO|nr:hypothetical protein BCR34DRAFT_610661 [Clohesyomyces aquaticus]
MLDIDGRSLLHFASDYARADICALLAGYGFRPEHMYGDLMPIEFHCSASFAEEPDDMSIATMRTLLYQTGDEIDLDTFGKRSFRRTYNPLAWLGTQAPNLFTGSELVMFYKILLRSFVRNFLTRYASHVDPVSFLTTVIPKNILQATEEESFDLLECLFWNVNIDDQEKSWNLGKAWLDLLALSGKDVEMHLTKEFENGWGGFLPSYRWAPRKVLVQHTEVHGWKLGWEFAYNEIDLGFELVSDFQRIAVDLYSYAGWPYL